METLAQLLHRLRAERRWTQHDLAVRSGCSTSMISQLERGLGRQVHRRNAEAIYLAFANEIALTEADAANLREFLNLPVGFEVPRGRLPDTQYLDEVAAGRVQYQGSREQQRPPVPRETIWLAGYRPGAGAPDAAELTVPVQQAIADLIVTVGPARAEAAIRALLATHAPPPPQTAAPKSTAAIKPPPGSIARTTPEGSKEFIPVHAQPKTKDPTKPQAQPIKKKGGRA